MTNLFLKKIFASIALAAQFLPRFVSATSNSDYNINFICSEKVSPQQNKSLSLYDNTVYLVPVVAVIVLMGQLAKYYYLEKSTEVYRTIVASSVLNAFYFVVALAFAITAPTQTCVNNEEEGCVNHTWLVYVLSVFITNVLAVDGIVTYYPSFCNNNKTRGSIGFMVWLTYLWGLLASYTSAVVFLGAMPLLFLCNCNVCYYICSN